MYIKIAPNAVIYGALTFNSCCNKSNTAPGIAILWKFAKK